MKLNHNETLSYPTEYDQTLYASVEQAFNMGAVAVGATIYFGSEQSRRQIEEISAAFERAHELGMGTVLLVKDVLLLNIRLIRASACHN